MATVDVHHDTGMPRGEPADKRFSGGKVMTLSAAHLLHDTFSSFLPPLLPLLTAKLGMSLSLTAFLDITRRLPTLFNPIFGIMAEHRGIKLLVILTPAVTAAAMSLTGLAPTVPVLFLLVFVGGISAALFHVPSPVLVREASGKRVGTGMSLFMVGGELARTLGPLLVTTAVSLWSLEGIFRLIPIGFAASLVLWFKLKDLDVQRNVSAGVRKGETGRVLRRYTAFFLVMGSFILFQMVMKTALTLYLPLYLTGRGAELLTAGASLSLFQFFGVLGTFLAGTFSDRLGRRATLVTASTGSVIMMALFLVFHHISLLALTGFFLFSTGPVLLALVQDTDSSMPTFMNSIYMAINFGIGSAAVFGLGVLGDHIGLEATYVVSLCVALGTIPAAFLLPRFVNR